MMISRRAPLSAFGSTVDPARRGNGPLGALPALSREARRALAFAGVLALLNAGALVAQAFLLASLLASIVDGRTGQLSARLAALFGAVLLRAVLAWASRVVTARAAAGAKEELRAKVLDHALTIGPEWIARRGPAELGTLSTRGLDALDDYFTEYLPALVTAAVVPVAAGLAVLLADWPSALIIVLTVPLLPMFAILVGKFTAERVAGATDAVHRMSAHLLELIRALPVLTAFRRAGAQAETVRKVSEKHRRATIGTLRVAFSSAFVLELAATLSVALIAVVIGVRLVSGEMGLAIGLGVLILAPECYQPLRTVGAAFHASEDGVEAVRRVAEALAIPTRRPGTAVPGKGEIHVRGLRVRRRDDFAPDGETFTVRPGAVTWLRSPSGAGKSTTLAVLLGFARPEAGTVTIADVPIDDVDMSTWRESVAWVPQSPTFTGDTVRGELRTAAAATDQEIAEVLGELDLAGIADEPSTRLSTGQRQRLAVARALLRSRHGAWLLLLDEPTAHLDAAAAERVRRAVAKARDAGAAVLIAAHSRTPPPGGHGDTPEPGDSSKSGRPDTHQSGNSLASERKVQLLRRLVGRRLLAGAALGAGALLAGIALSATSGWLIARAAQQPPILTLTVAVVGVRTFGLGRAALRYLERVVTHDGAFRVATRLRVELWRALTRLGPARTRALRAGEGQRRLVDDVDTVRDLLPRTITPPLVAGIAIAGAVVVQTLLLPAAGLALAVAVLVGATLAPLLALRVNRRATAVLAEGRRDVSARVLSLLDAAAELIAFGAHRTRRAELAAADNRLAATARRQALGAGAADLVIILASGVAAIASTLLAANAVAAGTLDPVLAPVLALIPLTLAEALALLPPAAEHWDTLRTSRDRLAHLLTQPRSEGHPPCVECGEGGLHCVQRRECGPRGRALELRAREIGWPECAEPVLRDVRVELPAGSRVAVVGPSGAGKSTMLAALLGFLPGVHSRLPEGVAWAPQEPQLVSTTVAENLRLADPHATGAQLRAALGKAGLPDLGLETRLDSAGAGLSGGQAQRVALARALLAAADAELVLLDEPTAHLDQDTADTVLANIDSALAGKTVLHVTHRPEEAAGADVVLEVRDGRVTSVSAMAGA